MLQIRVLIAGVLVLAALCAPGSAVAQPRAEAFVGQPFGVGRVEIEVPQGERPDAVGSTVLLLTEKTGRVYYPAASSSDAGRTIRGVLERIQRPRFRALGELAAEIPKKYAYFLFLGQEPLEITLQGRQAVAVTVTPALDPAAHKRLAEHWWRVYGDSPGGLTQKRPDYPPIVQTYLQATLARRLGLPAPQRPRKSWSDAFEGELGLSLASEPIRVSMLQDRMLGLADLSEPATLPLPPAIDSPEPPIPEPAAGVKVEPIAMAVPEECVYVRFGNFANFLWYQDTMNRWGGDLRNLLAQRGISHDLTGRAQRQMILRMTELSRLFGETAVADAAIVASDLFLPDGAALGILFQARNGLLLGTSLVAQRADALRTNKGAKEEKIQIAGRAVSFISTPDNAIRSFYATSGDFHFVTTSRTLVRRFLEAAHGQRALGGSKEFRVARSARPADPGDTVFIYISAAFFKNIVRPEYRVEISRRLQAAADIEAAEMAQLAAAAERQPGDTLEQLRAGGFFPPEFGPRPDGSQAVIGPERVYDSLRGARGTFVPVPDVDVTAVTRAEAEAYARFSEHYATKLGPVEPILAVMRRQPLQAGRERVVLEASLGPLNRRRYDFFAQWLGPADALQVAPVAGDALFVEAALKSSRLFVGLRDFGPPPEQQGGLSGLLELLPTGRLRGLFNGYIGTVGGSGLLGILDQAIGGPADGNGYAQSSRLLFRREVGPFRVFSLHREILAQVTPQLHMEQAPPRPAQIRVRVADLSQAGVAPVAQDWAYRRAASASLGNLRLINSMIQQFHVPLDDGLAAAQLLLGAKLVCPLGGEYVFRKAGDGSGYWTSTALENPPPAGLPGGFAGPPLNWFRGLSADAVLADNRLSVHAEIDMELPAKAAK